MIHLWKLWHSSKVNATVTNPADLTFFKLLLWHYKSTCNPGFLARFLWLVCTVSCTPPHVRQLACTVVHAAPLTPAGLHCVVHPSARTLAGLHCVVHASARTPAGLHCGVQAAARTPAGLHCGVHAAARTPAGLHCGVHTEASLRAGRRTYTRQETVRKCVHPRTSTTSILTVTYLINVTFEYILTCKRSHYSFYKKCYLINLITIREITYVHMLKVSWTAILMAANIKTYFQCSTTVCFLKHWCMYRCLAK